MANHICNSPLIVSLRSSMKGVNGLSDEPTPEAVEVDP
jgi:hypothetical protein